MATTETDWGTGGRRQQEKAKNAAKQIMQGVQTAQYLEIQRTAREREDLEQRRAKIRSERQLRQVPAGEGRAFYLLLCIGY